MVTLQSVEELIRELDQPDLNGWKLFAQTSDVKVYRKINEDKLVRYKCYSHIPDITPEIFYKVALDVEYRLVWDKYLKEATEIKDGDKIGIYWQLKMPLFIDNRDYTFVRDFGEYNIDNRQFYYVMTRSDQFQNIPPRKKVVRIETYLSQSLTCSDGTKGLKSFFTYYEDPKSKIPKALWTWAAKFGVPLFAKLTHNACIAYPEWIKDKKVKLPNVDDDDKEFENATAAAAAAMMSTDELLDDNENEQEKE